MEKSCLVGMVAFGLAIAVAPAGAARSFSGTHPLTPGGRVRVETVAGTVTVTAWDRSEVAAEGTMPDGVEFRISGPDDDVRVELRWPERRRRPARIRDEECRLEVRLPAGAAVETRSVSADVAVDGVTGSLVVQTVSGDAKVSGNPDRLNVEVVSGDITLDVGSRRVKLETVSGEVRARTGGGEFQASVVSGDVVLEGGSFESVSLEAVSGRLSFLGSLDPKGELEMSSHSGDIDVALRGALSARVRATTFSGSIRSELGGEAERASKHGPGEEYELTLGDGSGRITIDAFSGSVRLRRL